MRRGQRGGRSLALIRPLLEVLEDRWTPALLVPLGELAFYGDFTEAAGTFSATGTSADPIQVGLNPTLPADFVPLVTIDHTVSFVGDTTQNPDWEFIVGGDLATFSNGSDPTISMFENLSSLTIIGSDLVQTGSAAQVTGGTDIIAQSVGGNASIAFVPDHMHFADTSQTGAAPQVWLQGDININVLGVTGSVATSVAGNPIYVEVVNGKVDNFAATLNESISVGGLTFTSKDLTVSYTVSSDTLAIAGDTQFALSGNNVDVNWGSGTTSGLVVQNGVLTDLDMVVTGEFDLFGLKISPQALTFQYQAAPGSNTFKMFGGLQVTTGDNGMDHVDATFGTGADNAGLVVDNGASTQVKIDLSGTFKVFGLTFTEKDLTFEYVAASSHYVLYGSAEVKTSEGGLDETISFFDATTPGLVIDNGTITQVKVDLSGTFKVFGLTITEKDLTFEYSSAGHQYILFGDVSAAVANGQASDTGSNTTSFTARLGTEAAPGLIIQSGKITDVNVSVFGTLNVLGFVLESPESNPATFRYMASSNLYELSGMVSAPSSGTPRSSWAPRRSPAS